MEDADDSQQNEQLRSTTKEYSQSYKWSSRDLKGTIYFL